MEHLNKKAERELDGIIEEYGVEAVESYLRGLSAKTHSLTVIVNEGMHAIPSHLLRGDVFSFSSGQVELEPSSVDKTLDFLIRRGHDFLKRKNWNKVYIIPSGHPLLVTTATLLVFRSLRVDPVIVSYFGENSYIDVATNIRKRIFE
ncbi:hypothetical protein [Sphingomonas sp. AX6]|uniref:hypothetical protein n=1 Tax=Sphingomonas sp. AX6 TaxID=2653171 RepID=UPI0012F1694F|nr:hypothetical protein [Sphingomonas sp. AX6]VXC81696.1 conserved hypothetical protein [Sphingomonas sp. AX6]